MAINTYMFTFLSLKMRFRCYLRFTNAYLLFFCLFKGDKDELIVVDEPLASVNGNKSEEKAQDNSITGTGMQEALIKLNS